MSRKKASANGSTRISLTSLPLEILLLISEFLDLKALRDVTLTCSYMNIALDRMLYKQAMVTGVYLEKFVYAVIWGRTAAISKFLKAGVLITEFDNRRPFSTWPRSCDMEKDYVRCNPTYDWHPLGLVLLFGHIEILRVLITEGNINIDSEGDHGITVLSYAIQHHRHDMVKLLLEQGATVLTKTHDKYPFYSPIVLAAKVGNKEAVEIMYNELQNRRIPKRSILAECRRACAKACMGGFTDVVEFLLLKGVSANSHIGNNGHSLLHNASEHIDLPMVKLLVKHGAKMENEWDTGVVAAYCKRYRSREARDVVKYLLNSGLDNVANGRRYACALWRLARGFDGWRLHDRELIELLQKKGFDKENCQDGCWKGPQKNRYCFQGNALMSNAFFAYVMDRQPAA